MNKTVLLVVLTSISLLCCKQNSKKENTPNTSLTDVKDSLTLSIAFGDYKNLDFNPVDTITNIGRDSLKIDNIASLKDYDNQYLFNKGEIVRNSKGKIISLFVYNSGELTQYLVSYDLKNNYIDNIIVGYEDYVEYFSTTSATIVGNNLNVRTINYQYETNEQEIIDTIIEKYVITPEFKFIKQTE